jgi:hypothetical protein
MYALAWKSEQATWRKRWYALTSRVSLRADLYMTWEDHVFIADVVVINLTWETMVSSVINRLASVTVELNNIVRSTNIDSLMKGTTLF